MAMGSSDRGLTLNCLVKKFYQAFIDIKHIFDPKSMMNPGKVVYNQPLRENLRLSPETPLHEIKTFLDFSKEGGLTLAADLCNGNGMCRKTETTMCPSFQATRNEFDTTRARAQTLRGMIHGKLPENTKDLLEVMDLCLECKACKTECPSEVDMAKMQSEILHQHHENTEAPFGSIFLQTPLPCLIGSSPTPSLKKFRDGLALPLNEPYPTRPRSIFLKWFQREQHRKKTSKSGSL